MVESPSKTSRLRQKPETFRRLTGIPPKDFDEIMEDLPALYEEAEQERLSRPTERAPSAQDATSS